MLSNSIQGFVPHQLSTHMSLTATYCGRADQKQPTWTKNAR
jgi:hypothetical protein